MSFSIFTRFKAVDSVTPVFKSIIKKGNSFQRQAGKIQNAFGRALNSVRSNITKIKNGFSGLTDKIFSVKNALMGGFLVVGIQKAYSAIKGFVVETVTAAKDQTLATTKLYTILKNVHSIQARGPQAYKEAGDALSEMATTLQRVGIIGDEITLAGFQQLATFQMSDKEIKILAGGMSDLLAQQKGLNATQQDAVNIANLMGKVMDGQVGALRRVGVSFTKAEEKILKTGTRLQRASMLAKVLQNNVGGVNRAIARTPEGKIQNMTNQWSDMYENIGIKLLPVLADFAGWFAQYIPNIESTMFKLIEDILALKDNVFVLYTRFKGWYDFIISNSDKVIAAISGIATVALIANFNNLAWAVLGLAVKMGTLTASVWASVTAIAAQTAALIMNPMTWVAVAIGAVVAGLVLLALNWDKVKAATLDFVQKAKAWILDLWQKIEPIFNKIKEAVEFAFRFTAIGAVVNVTKNISERVKQRRKEEPKGFASGTNYFSGGLALVGEKGPELVQLPSATKIYNNSSTVKMIERMSQPRFNNVIDFGKYLDRRIEVKPAKLNQDNENDVNTAEVNDSSNEKNGGVLTIELIAPEGYQAKVVNARTSDGRAFKVKLRGKRRQ